ncbi:MAG TPA: DUF4430 domain-containing protein [Candidatus Thermoplasmatota archaeon]|nr:DUF4430 domain-containing protein [Candidatus Thermoplasmatota archaeon]
MKTHVLLVALLLASFAPTAHASAVTVTLEVDVADADYKTCEIAVPAGANGGDVLDAAVAQGCILLWTHSSFDGFGRYVTCIDAVCGAVATYWSFWVDGEYSSVGIDGYRATAGSVVRFNYEQWVLPL